MSKFAVDVHICGTVNVDAKDAEEAKSIILETFDDEYSVYEDAKVKRLVNEAYVNGAMGEDSPLDKHNPWHFAEMGFSVNLVGPAVRLDKNGALNKRRD